MDDRKHTIQRFTVPQVQDAISNTLFGEQNQRIMNNIFIRGMTYDQAAELEQMSVRCVQSRVQRIYGPVKRYPEQ